MTDSPLHVRTICDPNATPGEVSWAMQSATAEELAEAHSLLIDHINALEARNRDIEARRREMLLDWPALAAL